MANRSLFLDTDYSENERDGSKSRNQRTTTQSRNGSGTSLRQTSNADSKNDNFSLEGMESHDTGTNGYFPKDDEEQEMSERETSSRHKNDVSETHSSGEGDDYEYSSDEEEFESDEEIKTDRRSRKNTGNRAPKTVKIRNKELSRRLPSARWKTLKVFDDEDKSKEKSKNGKKKTRTGKTGKKRSNNSEENLVRPYYMASSTESDDDDDRKLDGRLLEDFPTGYYPIDNGSGVLRFNVVFQEDAKIRPFTDANVKNAGDLTSEYWQIQKLIRFVKIGNQTATLIALVALNDFDLRSELCQMSLRDVNGLMVLTNILRTDHDKCKIAAMKLLHPLTEKSKYNRRELVRFGAMHSLVDHIAVSDNRDVVGHAASIIANMNQCSLARNILKQRDGIRKLVNLLDFEKNDQLQKPYPRRMKQSLDTENLEKNLDVAKSAARALWSCCRSSQRCRIAVLKTGAVPHLSKLVALDNEEILVPVTGLIQECCADITFRQAVQHTQIMDHIVCNLPRNNLELKTYGAQAIFKCADDGEKTREIVYQYDGILPIMDLLSLKEQTALAAATGAVWKCAKSEENARRFLFLDMMDILLKFIHPHSNDEWSEEVQTHAIGAIGELLRIPEGCFELMRCRGCEALIGIIGHPNKHISANVAKAIRVGAVDVNCKRKLKEMDGIRLLWTLLKSFDDEVIINSAWALCLLIDDSQEDGEAIRSFVGGLEILVNLLKSENLDVLTSVCATISVIAKDYQNVGIISDYDVVELLAELTNVKDNLLRRYLAEAIARCSVFGDNAKAFRTSGAVSKVVKYLYIEDTPLQEATVRALYQLSRDPANCAIMHEYGGVKLLIEMVGSEDQELQEAAAGCLSNIRKLATATSEKSKKSKIKIPRT